MSVSLTLVPSGSSCGVGLGLADVARHRERNQDFGAPLIAAATAANRPLRLRVQVWSFEALCGMVQAGLGIARNILSDRLGRLVAGGILQRTPDPADKRRVIYALTDKGEALLPVVIALRQWSEAWCQGPASVVLADQRDGRPIRRICVQAEDGRALGLHELMWIDREDAKVSQAAE